MEGNIVERPFDASNKLHRSVYKGSPNIYTTSDVNRQIEALKWQIDGNENYTLVPSIFNCEIIQDFTVGMFRVIYSFDEIKAAGCIFKPAKPASWQGNLINGNKWYHFLVATKKQVGKEWDDSIIGADFGDGVIYDAAEAIVFSGERILATPNFAPTLGTNEVIVAYLGRIEVASFGGTNDHLARFYTNCLSEEGETLSIRQAMDNSKVSYKVEDSAHDNIGRTGSVRDNICSTYITAYSAATIGKVALMVCPTEEAVDSITTSYTSEELLFRNISDTEIPIYGVCSLTSERQLACSARMGMTGKIMFRIVAMSSGNYFSSGTYVFEVQYVQAGGKTSQMRKEVAKVITTTDISTLIFNCVIDLDEYMPTGGRHIGISVTVSKR